MSYTPVLGPGESIVAVAALSVPVRCTLTATDRRIILSTHKELLVQTDFSDIEEVSYDLVRGRHRVRMWTVADPMTVAEVVSKSPDMAEVYMTAAAGVARSYETKGIVLRLGGLTLTHDLLEGPDASWPLSGLHAQVCTGKELGARSPAASDTGFLGQLGLQVRLEAKAHFLSVTGDGLDLVVPVHELRVASARTFASAVNDRAGASSDPQPSSELADQVAALATLHAQGVLTDDEFSAAKARLFLA